MGTHLLQLAAADIDVEVVAHVAHCALPHHQGLTLAHFSAEREHLLWDNWVDYDKTASV